MSLTETLTDYARNGRYPMHMPGHKRNTDRYEMMNPYAMDITEIDGFDDLHEPEGILRRGMERAARVCGAEESWYLVGGSTAGILAAIGACVQQGENILVARNCHKSVYHAMELYHLRPIYVYPEPVTQQPAAPVSGEKPSGPAAGDGADCPTAAVGSAGLAEGEHIGDCEASWPIYGSIPPEAVERALADAKGSIGLAVITSPTYEGVISDVASIAAICHRAGVPLLVDEAHGAHLEVTGGRTFCHVAHNVTEGTSPCHLSEYRSFPAGALSCGADLVVQSLHKTLPAFTQTALLHRQGDLVSGLRVKHFLDILQTSSPSYILMAGIDRCIGILERERSRAEGAFPEWRLALAQFCRSCVDLQVLRVLGAGGGTDTVPESGTDGISDNEMNGIFARDPSKLVISAGRSGHTGGELMDALRKEGFELEMASTTYAIAMTGAGDRWEMLEEFAAALHRIDARWASESRENAAAGGKPSSPENAMPQQGRQPGEDTVPALRAEPVMPLWEAAGAKGEHLLWEETEGRISAEFLYAYPPGIPVLAPGERITEAVLAALQQCRRTGVTLRGAARAGEGVIRVVRVEPCSNR